MESAKQQIVERLKQANNILVTVRMNPTVDLLAACIGFALLLDKMEKHTAAVFSGEVPSTLEFLKPEETIETTPSSLRDFIISLDKSKADKLRYKVEDKVVRIFITPYKASITQDDLEFSEGDFNIDAVLALGVHEQAELDDAIVQHGRILHDATIISINNTPNGNLGSLNWQDISASSVSEMVASLAPELGANLVDEQIATALLTGVVAETLRFSNDKTTPQTMRVAGELMAAGANQQLVSSELQEDTKALPHDGTKTAEADDKPAEAAHADIGTLHIEHEDEPVAETPEPIDKAVAEEKPSEPAPAEPEPPITAPRDMLPTPVSPIDTVPSLPLASNTFTASYGGDDSIPSSRTSFLVDAPAEPNPPEATTTDMPPNPFAPAAPERIIQPPAAVASPPMLGADSVSPVADPPVDSVMLPQPVGSPVPPLPAFPVAPQSDSQQAVFPTADASPTLTELEQSVASPHAESTTTPDDTQINLQDARQQVLNALREGPQPLTPPVSLNAQPLGDPLHENTENMSLHDEGPMPAGEPPKPMSIAIDPATGNILPADAPAPNNAPLPPVNNMVSPPQMNTTPDGSLSPQAPPPVPPPFTPQSF